MSDWIVSAALVLGSAFVLLSSVGLLKMPDLFLRMQAATKSGTLGCGCVLIGVAVRFQDLGTAVRALLVLAFLFLTAPVAAHLIARAAYFVKAPVWERTTIDELRAEYDLETHELASCDVRRDP